MSVKSQAKPIQLLLALGLLLSAITPALTAFLRARLADDKPPPPADPDQPAT